MTTTRGAMLAVLGATVITSTAQILWKFGMGAGSSAVTGAFIIAGLAMYAIGAGILIMALRHGELSVLYPIIALSYVWVALLASGILGEVLSVQNWAGIIVIIAGVALIGAGAK